MAQFDVSAVNILGERGIRYKRNILAASLIATVLYLTNAALGDVSLFGVSLSNVEDKEAAAWKIFFVILIYHWIMLAYYGWTDWLIWQQRVRIEFKFSVRNLAFWISARTVLWQGGVPSKLIVFKTNKRPEGLAWEARYKTTQDNGVFRYDDRARIRWRLFAFLTIEFGLPFLWGLACLYLALTKILGSSPVPPVP